MRTEHLSFLAGLIAIIMMAAAIVLQSQGQPSPTGFFANNLFLFAVIPAAVAGLSSIYYRRAFQQKRQAKRVFIIYAREDVEFAKKLTALLREQGFNPWLDVEQIVPGQIWRKVAVQALEESGVALVLVSKNLAKDGFVREELVTAMKRLQSREEDISPIVPVRIDDASVPENLAHIQWVDLGEQGGQERLLEGLARATGVTRHPGGPAVAER